MRTLCQSVKSGTAADCFTLHQCCCTVVAEHRGAEICKHYNSHGTYRDSAVYKRDRQAEDGKHSKKTWLWRKRADGDARLSPGPNAFSSLVKNGGGGRSLAGLFGRKMRESVNFSSPSWRKIHPSSRTVFKTQMTPLPLSLEQKKALSNLTLSSARSIW